MSGDIGRLIETAEKYDCEEIRTLTGYETEIECCGKKGRVRVWILGDRYGVSPAPGEVGSVTLTWCLDIESACKKMEASMIECGFLIKKEAEELNKGEKQ